MTSESSLQMDPQAVAKVPRQQRARQRFEAVMSEAERVLEEQGLTGFSIPVVAERLQMTRGSVYAYFPTPYALLNEIVQRHLSQMETLYVENASELEGQGWWKAIDWALSQAMRYHNAHPAARMLLLGGALSDSSYRSLEALLGRLGALTRRVWEQHHASPARPLPADPDIFVLAIDIGMACFRRSFFEHGEIRESYKDSAVEAMRRYLEPYLDAPPLARTQPPAAESAA